MTNNELTHQPEKIGLEFLHSKGKKNQNSFQIPENHKGRKDGRRKRTPKYNNQKPETHIRTKLKAKHGDKQKNKTKGKKKKK
jgi:hypothetical protein